MEEAKPIFLNGYMQRCVYSVDRFGDLCRVGFDLRYLFGVLLVSGALCCHSGINELDESLQGRSIPHTCRLTVLNEL